MNDTDRDNFLDAKQALEYGIVDGIYTNRGELLKASASKAKKEKKSPVKA